MGAAGIDRCLTTEKKTRGKKGRRGHILLWLFTIDLGKPLGPGFVQLVSKTSQMGNSVRDFAELVWTLELDEVWQIQFTRTRADRTLELSV